MDTKARNAEAIEQVNELLFQILVGAVDSTLRETDRFDLKPPQMVFVMTLNQEGPLSMSEMSRLLGGIHPAVLSRQADRLEDKGLIKRTRDDRDRRVVHLSLTRRGRRTAGEIISFYKGLFDESLANLSATDIKALLRILPMISTEHSDRSRQPIASAGTDGHDRRKN